jgi:hypothetical protein
MGIGKRQGISGWGVLALFTPGLLSGCTGFLDTVSGPEGVFGNDENGGQGVDPDRQGPGSEVCSSDGPAPRMLRLLTRRELASTVRDLLNVDVPEVDKLPVEPRVRGFDNNASASVVTSRHVDEYVALAESLSAQGLSSQRAALACDPATLGCAAEFVQSFGLRAFRRPLEQEEVDRYVALFANDLTEGSFDQGMQLATQAMLISPSFLYRSEMGVAQTDGSYRLTPYEVASSLSYTFIGSMPDAELFEAAQSSGLETKAQIEAQAQRLLEDPRARDQVAEFVTQWLRTDGLLAVNKDKEIYPTFTDEVREAMAEEQRRFVIDLFFDSEGTYEDLFLADYVFANAALASFYGLSGGSSEYQKIAVSENSGRGGLLALGAVMASHAHSNESSPIKRGRFVRDRILCQDLPEPPQNLDTTPPGLDPSLTTRDRFQKHTADPACRGCHQYIDGVGFGFEGFDGVGAERTLENGIPVDRSGSIVGLESLASTDERPFDGVRGLSAMVAASASGQGCLPRQFYRFARGYAESPSEECVFDTLRERFAEAGLSLRELLVQGTQLDNFLLRK